MRSLSDSEGRLEMRVRDGTQLNRYHFGMNMVDFLICKNCGNYIGAVQQVDGQLFGIINAHLTDNRGKQFGEANHAFFEKETGEERSARRKEVWTPATLKADRRTWGRPLPRISHGDMSSRLHIQTHSTTHQSGSTDPPNCIPWRQP